MINPGDNCVFRNVKLKKMQDEFLTRFINSEDDFGDDNFDDDDTEEEEEETTDEEEDDADELETEEEK